MKDRLIKNLIDLIPIILFFILVYPHKATAQADTAENYFPTKVGTTWVYKIYPEYSNERERLTITKDSVSAIDSSHYLFLNGAIKPNYRVDSLKNVYLDPLGISRNANQFIFKQRASKLEAWPASDSSKIVYRIKEIGFEFILGNWVKVKVVEWGVTTNPDTFSFSRRSDYYGNGFGWYFTIVEPPSTERLLVGFIAGKDTLGDITKVIELKNYQVSSFILHQNFPNPFNPTTTIEYSLPEPSNVNITVFDFLGREVASLIHEYHSAGVYSTTFDASKLASGVYFYKITAGRFSTTKKMLLMK